MKRDFLEGLGLEKTVIDSIMTEHGKSVCSYKEQLSVLDSITEENRILKEENDRLSLSARESGERLDSFKRGVISELVQEARPSSRAAGAEIERLLFECGDGNIKKLLSDIMEAEPDAFKTEKHDLPYFSADMTAGSEGTMSMSFTRLR